MFVGSTTLCDIRNKKITGFPIPNKKDHLKISQYADDTNIFVRNETSIIEVLKIFEEFEQATGSKINKEKTCLISLGKEPLIFLNQEVDNLTKINYNEKFKILGIWFHIDEPGASKYNFQLLLEKVKKHIQLLSRRQLSLKGKAIIINSSILSKIQFANNVYSLPEEINRQLKQLIFQYIWDFKKTEPINRQTLHLPLSKGGINLQNSMTHNFAIRIKHLNNILNPEKNDTWILR